MQKLVEQGNDLLSESKQVLTEVESSIPWLEQLSSKLQSELSFLVAFLDKTELLVTDTFYCYKTLDQVSRLFISPWGILPWKIISKNHTVYGTQNTHEESQQRPKLNTNLVSNNLCVRGKPQHFYHFCKCKKLHLARVRHAGDYINIW